MTENKVIVYSTPTCPYCHQVKRYLAEKGIPFDEKDVAVDLQARDDMVRKSGQMGVPVVDVDGNIVVGFNRSKIDQLIALKTS